MRMGSSPSFTKDLVFLILQFLKDEKFEESMHKLEQDSGLFFNMEYFGEKILAGEWEEVEKYLSGFTKVDDNRHSKKIFYEIRKHKYLEALDRHDTAKAVEILMKDLKVFSTTNEEQELFKETTMLLTLNNFREHRLLSDYNDMKSARTILLRTLKGLIASNPLFSNKLVFPTLKTTRLRYLINQSLNWQHDQCKNPEPNPQIRTLFTDHMCPNRAHSSKPVTCPVAPVPRPGPYTPLTHGQPFPPNAAPNANIAGWMANSSASYSVQPFSPNQVSIPKRPRIHSNFQGMLQNTGHQQQMKSLQSSAQPVHKVTYQEQLRPQASLLDDLPRTLVYSFKHRSSVTSMDFHPSHQTLLLVGTGTGEVTLWEIGMRERLVSEPFKIWEMATCSTQFQSSIVHDPSISITRVAWSPDGNWMGVAFTKHLIHIYAYQGPNELRQHLEIDAHLGNVNDLAFCYPNKQLGIVTCGDDKIIKVWDLTGQKLFNFEGHKAPVFSVCPHQKENIQFVLSTDIDGKIKMWLYDNVGSRVDYVAPAPGHWCTTFLYSADGSRLFSCGTSKDGYSLLVEWNEDQGAIQRTYSGFTKKSVGVVQFDTTPNHFLAAGEDNRIKFWDMDRINVLATTDAEGGLSSLPRLRFNKEGDLLAVTTAENGFKILANTKGLRSLTAIESQSFDAPRVPISHAGTEVAGTDVVANINSTTTKVERLDRSSPARASSVRNGVDPTPRNVEKPKALEDVSDKPKSLELAEVVDHVECQLVTLPESADPASKVARLLYTNSGAGILALGSNGIQKLWKWGLNEQNPTGKATASVIPQHWQPNSGLLMTNDISDVNLEEAVPCIALSKNGSYVMSAAGGRVSLFNMMTFKVMTTFMPPPPASTFLVFHPKDNNIVAIGMEDSTTHIYNVRVDEVKTKLKGHQKRITGLAFSTNLNIMVSSGADAQLCTWNTDTWEKKKSVTLQHPFGKMSNCDTRVQFHSDQIRLLICHETQLAIYDASKMECIRQWVPQDGLPAPISFASYSCDSLLVYAAFRDGKIGVFDAETLRVRCHISPTAYITQAVPTSQPPAYPLVLATHPQEPNQLAVGLTDGSVKVIEPSESNGKWGMEVASTTSADNGTPNGRTTAATTTSSSSSSSATSSNHS